MKIKAWYFNPHPTSSTKLASAQTSIRATAHPNIALVKYWGKQNAATNLPAVPSLSITLDTLQAHTQVSESTKDSFVLNGVEHTGEQQDLKLSQFLSHVRTHHSVPPLRIESSNNFPTAAGLASSAAGFAALVTALNEFCQLGLSAAQKSSLARVGSASAARSVFGGFVGLTEPQFEAQQIAEASHWPLKIVVAITDTNKKPVSSTNGMAISASTSPFYQNWLDTAQSDYDHALTAIRDRDFAKLAEVSEHSCLKMHAVMQSSKPSLLYWNAASVACMHAITNLRQTGEDVFFTIDAGPQIKAICTQQSVAQVEATLTAIPGVVRTEQVALGGAAQLTD